MTAKNRGGSNREIKRSHDGKKTKAKGEAKGEKAAKNKGENKGGRRRRKRCKQSGGTVERATKMNATSESIERVMQTAIEA